MREIKETIEENTLIVDTLPAGFTMTAMPVYDVETNKLVITITEKVSIERRSTSDADYITTIETPRITFDSNCTKYTENYVHLNLVTQIFPTLEESNTYREEMLATFLSAIVDKSLYELYKVSSFEGTPVTNTNGDTCYLDRLTYFAVEK